MRKLYKICFLFCLLAVHAAFSQYKDLPNPPSDLQTIPQGSLVIPMDNSHQNLFLGYPFNLKSYGLVNQLLQNDIPVKWVIKAGKLKDSIDFSATVERVYPSFVAASLQDFRASEFIVDSFYVNNPGPTGLTATQIISAFANQWKVAVYRLTANTVVDVRYTLDHRPKIALFNNGGNEAIAETILDTAKISNYTVISAGVFQGLAQCYTFCCEMHWKMTLADTNITNKVLQFVQEGGNFLAQCHAVEGGDDLEGYEHNERFQTTTGLKQLGLNNASNNYYNPDLAFMQFEGLMQPNQSGSGKNWTLHAGSSWNSGVYHAVSTQNSLDTVIATGSHLAHPDSIGGNVFYLGGHNYSPYSNLLQINAARLYLNAALIPARRPSAFVVSMGANQTICQGQQTTLSASGPAGITYTWSPASSLNNPNLSNPIATPTTTTTYTVLADNNGCPGNGNEKVTVNPTPSAPTAANNSPLCAGSTISLNASTISGATYTWTGPNGFSSSSQNTSIANASSVNGGTYSVTATVGGCSASSTTSVTLNPTPVSVPSQINVLCFGGNNGTATASVSSGTPAYTYLWNNSQTTSAISNLTVGNYSVTVTDSKGCTATNSLTITQPGTSLSSSSSQNNISCFGGNNGSATISAAGGTPNYSYSWSNGNSTSAISNLIAGNYSVTVTDGNGCTKTNTITITQPSVLASSPTQTNVSCFGGNNGSANVSVSGGTPNFTYSWNNGNSTSAISNLTAGNYSVTVTDSKGCTTTNSFSITQPTVLTSSPSQNNISCSGGNNGSATISASGGTPNYTYSWSNGNSTSAIANLTAGNYSATIADSKGCITTNTFTITQPAVLTSSASQTNICSGAGNGTASVAPSGGTIPYSYLWNNGATASTATGLSAGNYSVVVTDAHGCTISSSVAINIFPLLTSVPSQNNVSCFGGNNGSAAVNISGGNSPYTYLWNNNSTASQISNLVSQSYSVLITDANGCTLLQSFLISEPTVLTASTSSSPDTCGKGIGIASVSVSGGVPSYTYSWSNGQTTSAAISLLSGNYTVAISDANGCTVVSTVSVTSVFSGIATAISQTNVLCFGGNNGAASVSASNGTSPYSYLWNNGQTTSSVTNLTAGNYSLVITDANGCTVSDTISITQPQILSLSPLQNNVSCFGGNNGSAAISVSGGTPNYSYSWNNGQTTSAAANLSAGNFSVTVTDANGCTITNPFVITQPTALTNYPSQTNVSCYSGSNGTATVNLSGGISPYTYLWSNFQTNSSATGLVAGNYSVQISDANGCALTTTFLITEPSPINLTTSSNATVCVGQSVTISASASGGTQPFTYNWSQSSWIGPGPHNVNQNVTATYTVNVMDANGCTSATDSITIFVYPIPTLNAANVSVCDGQTATITATPSGGTGGPYAYSWSNGFNGQTQTVAVPLNQSPKNFIVTVNDGCVTVSDTVTVIVNPLATGTISVNGNSGCAPLTSTFFAFSDTTATYSWNFGDGNSGSDSIVNHTYTSPGIYLVSVNIVTAAGCSTLVSGSTVVNVSPTPVANCGASTSTQPMTQNTIQFTNNSLGATNYFWNFGDGNTSTQANPSHYYASIGVYTITMVATNSYGCSDTCRIETFGYGITFPNAFTPNSNGPNGGSYNIYNLDNDVFFPFASGVTEFRMEIFNRWGELIFVTTDLNIGWDGYYRGKLCQQDVYVWKADATFLDGTKFHKAGDVTLLR